MWLVQTRPRARSSAGTASGTSVHEVFPSRYFSGRSISIGVSDEHCKAPTAMIVDPINKASLPSNPGSEFENVGYTPDIKAFSVVSYDSG
jgi:hypothetical protein